METILITGAGPKGVTGRLIKEHFLGKYNLLTPGSAELDLTNDIAVRKYFDTHVIDYVVHCATFRPTSVSPAHFVDDELESNLRMYFSLASQSNKYKKMIYLGSGAEFDKSKPIVRAKEGDFGASIPKNKYGLGKYIMNLHARNSSNIYNLRLFGTICKYEKPEKNVVSNLCVKAIMGLPLNLKQDCLFSFMDMDYLPMIIENVLTSDITYRDINIAIDRPYLLSEIAKMIIEMNKSGIYSVEREGLNLEYTANTSNLATCLSNSEFYKKCSVRDAVRKVFEHYLIMKDSIDIKDIDNRWK